MNTDIQSKQSPLYCAVKFPIMRVPLLRPLIGIVLRGHSTTTWTEFCRFLAPPPLAWTVLIPWAWTKTDIF